MIPDHALVVDTDQHIWRHDGTGWVCVTVGDHYPLTADELLAVSGPLDVLVWRHTISKDNE